MIDAFVKALLEYLIVFRITITNINTDQLIIGSDGQTLEGVIMLDGHSYPVHGAESVWFDSFLYIYKQYLENQKTVKEHSDMEFLDKVVKAANENHIPVKRIEREMTDKIFQYCVFIPEGSFNLFYHDIKGPEEHKGLIEMYEILDEPDFTDFVKALMRRYHRSFTPAIEPKEAEPVIQTKPKDIVRDDRIMLKRDIVKSELDKLGIDTEDFDFKISITKDVNVYFLNVSAKSWNVAVFSVQDETEFWELMGMHSPYSLAKHIDKTIKLGAGDDIDLNKKPVPEPTVIEPEPEPKPAPKKRGRPKGSKNKTETVEDNGLQAQLDKALAQINTLLKRIDDLEKRLEEKDKPKKPRKKSEPKPPPANPQYVLASKVMAKMATLPELTEEAFTSVYVYVGDDFSVNVRIRGFGEFELGKFDSLEGANEFMANGRKTTKPVNDLVAKLQAKFAHKLEKEKEKEKAKGDIDYSKFDMELHAIYQVAVKNSEGVHSKQEYELLEECVKLGITKNMFPPMMDEKDIEKLKKWLSENEKPEFESPISKLDLMEFYLSYDYIVSYIGMDTGDYSRWMLDCEELIECDKIATKVYRILPEFEPLKRYRTERDAMIIYGAPSFEPMILEDGIEFFVSHITGMYEDTKTKTDELTSKFNHLKSIASEIVSECNEHDVFVEFNKLCKS